MKERRRSQQRHLLSDAILERVRGGDARLAKPIDIPASLWRDAALRSGLVYDPTTRWWCVTRATLLAIEAMILRRASASPFRATSWAIVRFAQSPPGAGR